jgi:hypothetical protein
MAHGKDTKFQIGLAQFACSLDPDENLRKALEAIARRRVKALRLYAFPSSSGPNTSAGKRMRTCSISRRLFLGLRPKP